MRTNLIFGKNENHPNKHYENEDEKGI